MMKLGKLLTITLAFVLLVSVLPVLAADLPFNDVSEDDWYYDDVKYVYEHGLVNGKGEGFAPDDNLTFAEAVKLAVSMYQAYTQDSTQIAEGDPWYVPYVEYAKTKGIPADYPNYDSSITRAEYVHIFANALPTEAFAPMNKVSDNIIPDVKANVKYAEDIYLFYRAGILTGNDEVGTFGPGSTISRCQVAAIMARMMDSSKRVKKDLIDPDEKPVTGKGSIPTISEKRNALGNKVMVFTFESLPESAADLAKYTQSSPFETAALVVTALRMYDPSNPNICNDMLQALMGSAQTLGPTASRIKDRMTQNDKWKFIGNSYINGATPENNYTPDVPYVIEVEENPYAYDEEGYAKFYLKSGGADSGRPIQMRQMKNGTWVLWSDTVMGLLSDIRPPSADDPWA